MRKLVVLCLAVGLALASSEQWFGRSPAMAPPVPNPQPGVFPFSPTPFLDAADTLKYDDNAPYSAWRGFNPGDGFGVKFISPGDNVTLAGALIHYWTPDWPTPGDSWAKVKVFADDGIGGAPGTQLFTSDSLKITRGAWNYIPINTSVVASNFYIFHEQVGSDSFVPGLSIDQFNNAPSGREWEMHAGGGFAEESRRGDWLIRAVLDWTPQDTNASAVWFSSMPTDTVPNVNLTVRAVIKNMGSATLPVGLPVRLSISGPGSYTFNDTMATTAALAHGATRQINFTPAWHIPDVAGNYNIKVWTEAAGEDWPADDTMSWDLSCAKWLQYVDENSLTWISPAGPDKATQFNPANFSLQYPVGLTRVRAEFYSHPQLPWTDSSFQFLVYGDDGATLLYESETLEATAGMPGAPTAYTFAPTLVIQSGSFYVAVHSITENGRPTLYADNVLSGGHSYYGSANNGWTPSTEYPGGASGEWFISFAGEGNYGVEEGGFEPGIRSPNLQITNFPNPVGDQVTLKWQVPNSMPISVNLYDATGRMVRNLYAANDKARVGTLTMDTRSLAAGIYLARLETANGSATRKLVIDR